MSIKRITAENWLERDGIQFAAIEWTSLNDSYTHLMDGEDWIRNFTESQLSNEVPADIHTLFEVARGALCYGYFFYPLYTLGFEQLFRVGEAAISARFLELGGDPKKVKTFEKRIEFLEMKSALTGSDASSWTAVRHFRNLVSHPESQNIFPPGQIAGTLNHVCALVNRLFQTSRSAATI